ncbi:hypothetical protein OE88DRAFT_875470 [Heliocybe sulcata]|uniref:Uncharacterized protein n=1 Tax=Heliocybe sulcata TaxID=5364 RepID=A0A5C3MMH8_9AGAM|nr:hypothetical protein OE88DRAFT_875470 [Heliocybe sulcata]
MNLFHIFRVSCMSASFIPSRLPFQELTISRPSTALISLLCAGCVLACTALSPHIVPKSYLVVPICVPALTFIPALWALLHPVLRPTQSQHVVSEMLWTIMAVPFLTSLAIFISGIYPVNATLTINAIFQCLQWLTWALFSIVTLYAAVLAALTLLTRLTLDRDIWFRDITSTPSPFPVSYIFRVLRDPSLADRDYHNFWTSDTRENLHHDHSYCMPGCTCSRKVLVADLESSVPYLDRTERDGSGSGEPMQMSESRRQVPVRLPTAMERVNSIPVGLRACL